MNTHEGYSKKTISNANVLLAGGGDKSLADFLGGIRISASKIQYKTADAAATWTNLITLVNTDENVKLTPKTDNANRPLMMINGSTSTGELTSTSMFSTGIYANASTNMITANGFVKTGSDSSHVLLGDGGHKDLSDFSMSGHNHNDLYVSSLTTNGNYLRWVKNGNNNDITIPYATTSSKLMYHSMLNYRTDFDSFSGEGAMKVALFQNKGTDDEQLIIPFSDGSLISFPWGASNSYGAQLAVEDRGQTNHLAIRNRNGTNSWGAWAMILTSVNYNLYSPKLDGTGASGTWAISISGNAATATKLETARTINGVSFDGSANIAIAPSLLISGNTIASQVGDLTSSYITVPYATNSNTSDRSYMLLKQSQLTTMDAVNAFHNTGMLWALVSSIENPPGNYINKNDGFIISFPWGGNNYGQLFYMDDSGYTLMHRYCVQIQTSALGVTPVTYGRSWANWVKILDTSNISPSLDISGNTIRVTTGGVSSSYITVPYATNAGNADTLDGYHASSFLQSQDHYKTSPGAGTAGTSSATSGSTLSVPYVTVNANGHVTGYGTHTHTVTGFLTSHLSVVNSNPNIKYGNTMTIGSVGGTNLLITLPNNEGTSDFTDSTELLTSYASNNGFADTNAPGVIYRRKAVSMYNYLVSKGFLTSHQSFSTFDNYHNTNNSYNAHQLRIKIGSTTKYCTPEWLNEYEGVDYGANGLQYMNIYGPDTGRGTASTNGTPTDDWYHIIRMNHSNNGGYFVDIAACFHSWNLWYRRIKNGSLEDSTVDSGWARILDSKNSSVSGGGSSWGSSITVKINGTSKTLTIPSNPNTNTWRKVLLEGVDKLGTGTGTNPLNIKAGTGMSITESGGAFTFTCTVTGSNSVAWVDVTDKIHGGNEFNMVNDGYSSTLWFNYCPVNNRSGSASVSEYIFGNGNKGKANICANTVYPSATNTYYLGQSSYVYAGAYTRFIQSDSALSLKTNGNNTRVYINTSGNVGIGTTSPSAKLNVIGEAVIGESNYTAPQGTGSNYSGTWIGQGWMELSTTDPYIDFHRNKSTADYTSRLIHWNDKVRLKYENSDSTYSGYVLTCEGNHHNPVILGIFDLRRWKPDSTSWSLDNICGPCYFSLLNSWGSDVSYSDSSSSWTIPSNLLRVEINSTLGANYTTKNTVKAAACIGTVMTRWINNHPVVANCLHGDWQGCSVECLCTDKAPGYSINYASSSPGKYIYITGARPWGYDDDSNGLGMDQFRQTGNLSYQRVRFVVYGWLE